MIRQTILLAAALSATVALPSAAQDDDGWDVTEADGAVLASAAYETGQAFVVRCRKGRLDVMMTGTPADPEDRTRWLEWSAPGGSARQTWISTPGQSLIFAVRPIHVARLLKEGGALSVRLLPTEHSPQPHRYDFQLPQDSGGIDQVLTACKTRTDNPRDALIEVEQPFERPGVPANIQRIMPTPAYPTSAMSAGSGEVLFSCVVAKNGSLDECRIEMETPPDVGFGRATLLALSSARLRLGTGVEPGRLYVSRIRYRLQR